jgi:hypothetical protein
MIHLTNPLIRQFLEQEGLPDPEPDRIHLLGLRGARVVKEPHTITRVKALPDHYDDLVVLFGKELWAFPATVDPGHTYTWAPLNPRGCAHLANGGPYLFRKGLHKKKRALVQAEAFLVWRDRNRNGLQDSDERARMESGIGLNLHRGGASARVGPWSAGCQVLPTAGGAWDLFERIVWASPQTEFHYWLADASRLPVGGG